MLERKIEKITLQVTQSCNLRCTYCIYSENGNLSQRSHSSLQMSFETAKRALDFYRVHSEDTSKIHIGFYGGEPLLSFPMIRQIIAYSEKIFSGKSISYDMTTNATLLTDEIIDYLNEKKVSVMLSLDGSKRAHDLNRKFPDGKGSFASIMDNLGNYFEKAPENVSGFYINTVITPNQDYDEVVQLYNIPMLKKSGLQSTLVEEDAVPLQPSTEYQEKYSTDYFRALVETFRGKKINYPNKLIKRDLMATIDSIHKMKTNIVGRVSAPSGPCVPGKLRLFVNCVGEFYPCERVNENQLMKIGSLEQGIDYQQVETILNIGRISSEKCRTCWAFSLCNICAKRIDGGGVWSPEKKSKSLQRCQESSVWKNFGENSSF